MFDKEIYINRRNQLKKRIKNGLVLILGNNQAPMNYPANTYPFRQDSTFLYFFGLDLPGLAGVIDIDMSSEYPSRFSFPLLLGEVCVASKTRVGC
ncbi:MAG: aminopeptidase P N-terminal domain-containing protein [Marinilabilia sp.]